MAETISSPSVHIVVTCTNRKRYPVPDNLRLGHLRERRPGQRFAAWTHRLAAMPPSIPATDLYGGEHWQVARSLPTLINRPAKLWVCSAGYGLVPADAPLNAYAATFSSREPDSVGETRAEVLGWWRRLIEWPGPDATQPRSLADLARRNPTASIVVVLSDAYLRACSEDLLTARETLSDQDRLTVVGPATGRSELDDMLVPVTARMQSIVGGSLLALHARVAAHLLTTVANDGQIGRARLREAAREAVENAPDNLPRRTPGIRLADDEVRDFIRQELATRSGGSATTLLRRLRQSGHSCEQSRFKHLYAETTAVKVNA